MFALSREIHKYLIEPIGKTWHIKISLMERYIQFSKLLSTSTKNVAQNMFNSVRKDCQSNTGYNLRKIMLHNADLVDDLTKILYYILPDHELWRIPIIREISETKTGKMAIEHFTKEELSSIKEFACCM